MAYISLTKHQLEVPFGAKLKAPIFRDGDTYVQKHLMQEEKYVIWFSQVLIPYSVFDNVT